MTLETALLLASCAFAVGLAFRFGLVAKVWDLIMCGVSRLERQKGD